MFLREPFAKAVVTLATLLTPLASEANEAPLGHNGHRPTPDRSVEGGNHKLIHGRAFPTGRGSCIAVASIATAAQAITVGGIGDGIFQAVFCGTRGTKCQYLTLH